MWPFKKKEKTREIKKIFSQKRAVIDSAILNDALMDNLHVSNFSNNRIVVESLDRVRSRSRTLYHNSDYLRKFVLSGQRNIVGEAGIIYQSLAINGGDGKPNMRERKSIEAAWKDFSNNHIDVNQQLTLHDIEMLWVQSLIVDGAFLAIKNRGRNAGKYGFSLQVVDSALLDTSFNEDNIKENRIVGGIELTPTGKPVNYYLLDSDMGDYLHTRTGKKYRVIPASDVIYSFINKYIGQTHGTPETWSSITTLHNLNEIEKASLAAAREGSSRRGYIESSELGAASYVGDEERDDGVQVHYLENGTVEELPYGKKFVSYDMKFPHEQVETLLKHELRKLASGWGMSYADLTDDLTAVNLSSYRGSTSEARETWKLWQNQLIRVLEDIHGEFAKMGLLMGQIGNMKPAGLDKVLMCSFQGRRWFKLDPVKDEDATRTSIELGRKSVSETIREDGRDPEKVFAEIEEERERFNWLNGGNNEQENETGREPESKPKGDKGSKSDTESDD